MTKLLPAHPFKTMLDSVYTLVLWRNRSRYAYFHRSGFQSFAHDLADSNYHEFSFIVVSSDADPRAITQNQILGWIHASRFSQARLINNVVMVSFTGRPITDSIYYFLEHVFEDLRFNTMHFSGLVGGSSERAYVRHAKSGFCRYVGVLTGACVLGNGSVVDESLFEMKLEHWEKIRERYGKVFTREGHETTISA